MGVAGLLLFLIRFLLVIYDFITYPIYFLLQQPWRKTGLINRVRARVVDTQATEVTIRAVPMASKVKDELLAAPDQITTMEKLFKFLIKKHGNKRCLGTREILGESEEKQENGKVFVKQQLGQYSWQTYADLATQSDQLGKGLRELGVKPRDKVVLYANTCAEWMVSAVACFKQSLAVVTIYTNLGEEGVEHGITQTEATLVIVSQELVERLQAVLPKAKSVRNVVVVPTAYNPAPLPEEKDGVSFHKFSSVLALGSQSTNMTSALPEPQDTAIIMYTSGSTGVPKGVVQTHQNLVHALYSIIPTACDSIGNEFRPTDCYIAVLPLAHVLELLAESLMLVLGVPIGYSSPKTFTDRGTMVAKGSKGDATVLQPTIVCVVPLVLDSIYKGIKTSVAERGIFFSGLVEMCYQYRMKWVKEGHDTPIMNRLIFNKFKAIVGGRLRVLLSGGAPLAPDAHDFCRTCLGINLLQGYGLTETCATACIPDGNDLSTGRVGSPLQEVDIKLVNWEEGGYRVTDKPGPRGEIVIGGGHIAKEYYGLPDKTEEEFFSEGGKRWFRTGDIGQMCGDIGTIKIIDRKKDLVKLQGGEYVSLGKVESLLKIHPAIENICVYADPSRSNTVALVIPGQKHVEDVAAKIGKSSLSREDLCLEGEVVSSILTVMAKHGAQQKLQKFEIPRAVFLVSEPWTPESGLITAAMKLKRKSLENAYQDQIAGMYSENNNSALPKKMVNNNSQPRQVVTSV